MKNKSLKHVKLFIIIVACLLFMAHALADDKAQPPASAPKTEQPKIDWQVGPTTAKLGDIAEIKIPEGFQFTGKEGTQKVLEITHNPVNGNELGCIIPVSNKNDKEDDSFYFITFQFDETGYVKDDEKNKIDAKALLESLKEGTEEANKVRQERGWQILEIKGWQKEPYFDDTTKNLTWSIQVQAGKDPAVNHSTRILGRRGTMSIDLVMDPKNYQATIPTFNNLLIGFSFTSGNKYSEFVKGDKVAEYGLLALIAGGAGAAAMKYGIFGKLWKVIALFFVKAWKLIALGIAAIGSWFKKIFGKNTDAGDTTT
jgi:uncharacterized membrane-anchored protein